MSVGTSSLKRRLSRFFVGMALYLSQYRSFRDPESKQAVKTLLHNSHDSVYPDLAFSYPFYARPAAADFEPGGGSRLTVGVSPIAYWDPRVWPLKDAKRYADYVNRMTEFVRWLLAEGYKVLFFTTNAPDIKTTEDILAMLADNGVACSEIETLPSPWELGPGELLARLCVMDLVIASRLHGVILSHLSATPVLALSYDPKVDSHMKAIGQEEHCLNIDDLTLQTLSSRFCSLRDVRQREQAHIRREASRFRYLLDLQYDRILGPPPILQPSDLRGTPSLKVGLP